VRTGATDAFGEIVEHYQAPIVRYLSRLTGDAEVARDLAQDTFVQAYRGILKTRSELHFKAWLYRIARNNALQYHRRRRLLSFVPFMGSESPEMVDTSTSPDAVPERMTIQEALLAVPIQRRECLVLHFVEGLKYREIAAIVDTTEEAVRKRVSRGSKEFRAAYRRLSGDEQE
jgi:RNA polymerase sigma-70 factor (ECF subfamily)